MLFYYNAGMNLCADEKWLVEYLVINKIVENEDEALEGLRGCREFHGWFECEVANSIAEGFEVQLIGY